MSAPDTTRLQANFRVGDALINVYATSEADLAFQLDSLRKLAGDIASTDALLKAASTTASTPPASEANNVVQGNFAPQQQSSAQTPTCLHGARQYRTGNGKRGPWSGWFCPAKQCEVQWQGDK